MSVLGINPSPITRQTVACHLCSGTDEVTYLEARGYRIAQCRGCGLWFVNPQPTVEELRQFYARYDDGEQWRKGEEHFNRGIHKAIARIKPSGAVLDIGCGSGNFLRCMKEGGYSVLGIEPSESGSQFAREEHSIEIYHGMIEDFLKAHGARKFDVITLLNVLEHLTHPAQSLLQLRQILASDGVLALVVPDARFHDLLGRLRRFAGFKDAYWLEQPESFLSGFKLPDHLCSFQPGTIASLLRRCGYRVVALRIAPLVLNPAFHRNAAKFLVRWVSQIVYYLTFQRVLVGYSTLVLAQREQD
ncbi:MAG: class I SAM-dependent methyltransferase [Terriglobia bacterium]|jgi:SAM-dependent methyltransferase